MSWPSDTRDGDRLTDAAGSRGTLPLALDRIKCTGHGICASLLPEQITADEWGYPVIHSQLAERELGDHAIRLCPARALDWSGHYR